MAPNRLFVDYSMQCFRNVKRKFEISEKIPEISDYTDNGTIPQIKPPRSGPERTEKKERALGPAILQFEDPI